MATSMSSVDDADPTSAITIRKKLLKKLNKLEKILASKELLELSKQPTKVLCVQNGGLGNSVSQEELQPIFSTFGEVEGIIMVPKKQYCFVCFVNATCASEAMNHLNGCLLRKGKDPTQDVILYLFYVERAPSSVMPSSDKPPGLHIVEDFVTPEVEKVLLELVERGSTKFTDKDSGVMKHRQVQHFGYEFKYDINDVDINDPLPNGIPEVCHEFLERAQNLGLVHHFPDQLTVNQYKPGQGIPPHIDTPGAFEDGIMSLSLGSQVVMDFRHPDGRHLSVLLPRRSLLVMTAESRYVWSHGITPRKSDIVATSGGDGLTLQNRDVRTSFTFRKVVMNRKVSEAAGEGDGAESRRLPQNEEEAIALEKQHVHKVYNDIANHFSGTRYKAWPRVEEFIKEQPPYSLLADVGCGNGKCLGLSKDLFEIGSDYSSNLASICRSRGFETCVADVTCLPFRSESFDVILCIAVIHHMATKERRHKAVSEVVRLLRQGGKALIYVWAMEQELNKTPSKYINSNKQKRQNEMGNCNLDSETCSPRDVTEKIIEETSSGEKHQGQKEDKNMQRHGSGVSVISDGSKMSSQKDDEDSGASHVTCDSVPATQKGHFTNTNCDSVAKPISVKRASHETSGDGTDAMSNRCDIESGSDVQEVQTPEAPQKLHVHVNRTQFKEQDMLVPWQLKCKVKEERTSSKDGSVCDEKSSVFHRFYHVFRQGELEAVCKRVPGCVVCKSYYDQGNWCVVLEKL